MAETARARYHAAVGRQVQTQPVSAAAGTSDGHRRGQVDDRVKRSGGHVFRFLGILAPDFRAVFRAIATLCA